MHIEKFLNGLVREVCMKNEFENGNTIKSIESSESKTSREYRILINPIDDCYDCIRGKQMTDEEYRRFLNSEQVNAESNVDEVIRRMEL